MRVLVTGATGFVGRWLMLELRSAGHTAVGTPGSASLEITDREALAEFVADVRADAVVHLAGVAHPQDAARDPGRANAVNVGGTEALIAALVSTQRASPLLIVSSSEVYGRPQPEELPLTESAPTLAAGPYGLSKVMQERVALGAEARFNLPVVIARPFNHTGPGQRVAFVAPALARRVLSARKSGADSIRTGNVDVRRDIGDVRDFSRAYRLLLEGLAYGTIERAAIVNVATGRAVSIRTVLSILCRLTGVDVAPVFDPELARPDDPPEIVGDASRLASLTGWKPTIELEQTLADVLASVEPQS